MEFTKINMGLKEWLLNYGLSLSTSNFLCILIVLFAIIIISLIANFLVKTILLAIIRKVVKKTKNTWDDVLLEKKVFHKLSQLVPILIVYYSIEIAFESYSWAILLIKKLSILYLMVLLVMIIFSFLNAVNEIYNNNVGNKKGTSIKSYIQVVKIFVFFIVAISALSYLLNKEVGYFITGLGAMTAVLMLIFKDSILGLVSGIQLSTNDMVRIGDWISMDERNTDGIVTELSLNTVKVQNWDNTISTIPTYAMITESFSNWRGMEESGGRRIKRSIKIDMNSVKFCDNEMLKKMSKISLIKNYVENKSAEIEQYNKSSNLDTKVLANGRRMTNLGTFRIYITEYLKANDKINKDLILVVRQLEPTANGLPLEIYAFCSMKKLADFEQVQSDIFDHILAIMPEFNLRIFQSPMGSDFKSN